MWYGVCVCVCVHLFLYVCVCVCGKRNCAFRYVCFWCMYVCGVGCVMCAMCVSACLHLRVCIYFVSRVCVCCVGYRVLYDICVSGVCVCVCVCVCVWYRI